MQDTTPKLITVSEFNQQVRGWTVSVRQRITRNVPVVKGILKNSIENYVDEKNGVATKIRYSFERYGVFIHYGVGRGYIRVGNMVVRGRRLTKPEQIQYRKRGEKNKDIKQLRVMYSDESIDRFPYDWFDVEIRQGLAQLADVVQDYKGDIAMRMILSQMDKATIQKKI